MQPGNDEHFLEKYKTLVVFTPVTVETSVIKKQMADRATQGTLKGS